MLADTARQQEEVDLIRNNARVKLHQLEAIFLENASKNHFPNDFRSSNIGQEPEIDSEPNAS